MQYLCVVFLLSIGLTGCESSSSPADQIPSRPFYVSDPAHLFFKNLRVTDYTLRNRTGSKADLYFPKDMARMTELPNVIPYIVDDWLNDQAFLFFDLLPHDSLYADPVRLKWVDATSTDSIVLERVTPQAYAALGRILQKELPTQKQFSLLSQDEHEIPVWEQEAVRQEVMMTLRDYFRLIDEEAPK